MEPLNQHNTLLPKPLEVVGNNDIDCKVLSLEDNVVGKLISLRPSISILEVELPNSKVNVTRPTESLRKLPPLVHSHFCGAKPTECLACFLSSLNSTTTSPLTLSGSRSPLPIFNRNENKKNEFKPISAPQKTDYSHFHRKVKIEAPKDYPLIPLKPQVLPLPPQFLIPPQTFYVPKKIRLHCLHHKKVKNEVVMIEELPKKNDSFVYITDLSVIDYLNQYLKGISLNTFISLIGRQLNDYSYDFGCNSHVHSLCDSIEMLRTVQAVMNGLESGKLTIPNDCLDPMERTLVSQLLNSFFIPPMPFINPVTSSLSPISLPVPCIVLGAVRESQNHQVIDMAVETSWEMLTQWEEQEFSPFSFKKDINYMFVSQEGIDSEIVQTVIKEIEFDYANFNLGKLNKVDDNCVVSSLFDELEINEIIKNHQNDIGNKKIIVLFDNKSGNEEENLCRIIALKCKLNELNGCNYAENMFFIPLTSLLKGSLREMAIRICFSLYSSHRRYRPTQYPNSAAQALPNFLEEGHLMNEPLFIISPQNVEYVNKVMIGYKYKQNGIISCLINFTGELQEVGFDHSMKEMWDRWICFIQTTTRSNWQITFTKIGDIETDELKRLGELKDSALNQFNGIISSIYISCCDVYGSMLVSEEEYELLDNNKGFYKVNDKFSPSVEIKGEGRATYYSVMPSLIGKGSTVGGYSINLYDSSEEELNNMMKIFHNLSFLNSDPLKEERWSLLPKHLHILQKYDLYLDLTGLCEH